MVTEGVCLHNCQYNRIDEPRIHHPESLELALALSVQRITYGIRVRNVLVVGGGAKSLAQTLSQQGIADKVVVCDTFANDPLFPPDSADVPPGACVATDACNLPFSDRSFDLCIVLHAIERIHCTVRTLEEFQRVARYLVLEATSERSFRTRFQSGVRRDRNRGTSSHVDSLNQGSLRKLLVDSGLRVLRGELMTIERNTNGSCAWTKIHLLFCRGRGAPPNEVFPRVLHVDTTSTRSSIVHNAILQDTIDYSVYARIPRWWRGLEQKLRMDLILALHVRRVAEQYDVIMAGSEKVGIPLALMRLNRPVITTVHHMASRRKKAFLRLLDVTSAWTRTAYLSEADREVMISYYGVPEERLFKYSAAPLGRFRPTGEIISEGPIMSIGLSDRDYPTLIEALRDLPGYHTEIYGASRYEDLYGVPNGVAIPEWIYLKDKVSLDELVAAYKRARFVVLPVKETTQFSAGITAALEAQASGKAVIATRTRGMPDYVIDGVTGFLVSPGDVKGLRDAVSTLWNNPRLAQQMGLAGRRHVEMNFNPEVEDERLRNIVIDIWEESLSGSWLPISIS